MALSEMALSEMALSDSLAPSAEPDPGAEPDPCTEPDPGAAATSTDQPPFAVAGCGLELPLDLQAGLQAQADQQGCSLADLVERLLRRALVDSPREPSGRCSTRMGHRSSGPVPLPVQQL